MPFFLFSPDSFDVNSRVVGENVYIQKNVRVDRAKAAQQHRALCRTLGTKPHNGSADLPDQVFAANVALPLPRLPKKVFVLARFKHNVRQPEVDDFRRIAEASGAECVPFPKGVFEGQGECQWFHHGRLLLLGYGFRSSAASVATLRKVLQEVYGKYGVEPPTVMGVELASPFFYHLDLALSATSQTACVAQKAAFADLEKLAKVVDVVFWKTGDKLLFNCVVTPYRVIVHTLHPSDRVFMEAAFSPREIVELDVSEFEKSGGSVKCMTLSY